MNQYLLLRDNKQTGPYSKDELVTKGLKAYDLVWLEGKSAAWRYPSEIDELKPFAPVVEEQPYDRFFKKPSEQATADNTSTADNTINNPQSVPEVKQPEVVQETVTPQPAAPAAATSSEEKPAANEAPARHIYVNMPAAGGAATQPVNSRATTTVQAKADTITTKAIPEEQSPYAPRVSNPAKATPAETKTPASDTPNDRFSETASTASSWSENAAGRYHKQEKEKEYDAIPVFPKNNRRKQVTRSLVAACLLLGGVAIGLFISYNGQQTKTQDLEQLVKQIYEKEQARKQEDLTRQASVIQPVNDPLPPTEDNSDPATPPVQDEGATDTRTAIKPPAVKKPAVPAETGNTQPAADTDNEVVAMNDHRPAERKSQTREQENGTYQDAAIQAARKNIFQLVEVAPNEYKTGLLGGISNLNLTLSNNSHFPLDQVAVEIKYLGPEKKVVKTQTIVFNDIAPGEQKTLEAPRTNRGVTIDYTITHINSRILGLAQVGL